MNLIKQSTACTLLIGPFLDDGDGKSAETGLTISQADVRLSKNGGNMAQKSDSTACTHDELGYYTCPLNTTDTNTLGILRVMVHESGALPVWYDCQVVTANVYDTLCSTDSFDVNVTAISGDTTAADNCELMFDGTGYAGGTTKLGVDAVAISGDTTAANNLEAACDGTGYNIGGGDVVAASVTAGVTLANDAITAAKFDETTAFPLKSADTGATAVARTGADSDTLATLSDQMDGLATDEDVADAILNEVLSGHTVAGSFGKAITDILADTTLIEKWIADKLVTTDNEDGTLTAVLYDSDGTTPLKTWVFTTATGTRAAAT